METELSLRKSALRAYELGRLRRAALNATMLASLVGVIAMATVGPSALPWALCTLGAWIATGWRGGALLLGAKKGLIAGFATLLLPLSLLRPCCRPGVVMTADCCTRPELCVLAGSAIGFGLAALLPKSRDASRWETAGGMVVGVLSVAVLKCSKLFVGEAMGLLVGLSVGVLVVSSVASLRTARSTAA
ncbi:MAG: hypothetical protein Q8Q09_27680 [Deltaproteobacteria bacterium]|nr:hypothetical protein [Deltaproteobacteria bacterium]